MPPRASSNGRTTPAKVRTTPPTDSLSAPPSAPVERAALEPGQIAINYPAVMARMQTRIGALSFEVDVLYQALEDAQAEKARMAETIDTLSARLPKEEPTDA